MSEKDRKSKDRKSFFPKLCGPQGAGLMQEARLSFTQYIKINRYLEHYNSGLDLLPGYAEVKKVIYDEHAVKKLFGVT